MAQVLSRRDLLFGKPERNHVYPPGITLQGLTACTGCGDCAKDCPAGIIQLVANKPTLNFEHNECTFCGACKQACHEPVFTGAATDRFDHIVSIRSTCLAFQRIDCQACRDACSAGAIRFLPVRGGPFVPELMPEACTGCGACISVCPVVAVDIASRSMEAING